MFKNILNVLGVNKKSYTYGNFFGDGYNQLLSGSTYKYDINFYIGSYETNPVVHAATDKISSVIGGLPVVVKDADNEDEIERVNQNLANILSMPNYRQDWNTFIKHLITWLTIAGNAYVYRTGETEEYTEFFVLPNNDVIPNYTNSRKITGYHITNFEGDDKTVYEPIDEITGQSRVLHIKNLCPREDYGLGLSALEPLRRDIIAMGHALGWSEKTMRNRGTISGLFMTEGQLSDKDYERTKARLQSFTNQGSDTGSFMVIDGSQAKFVPMQQSAQEVDFLNTIRAQSNRIAGGIGVPSALLNLGTSTSASNQGNAHVDGVRDMFYNDTILPLASRIARAFNMFFRKNKLFDGNSIHLDTIPLTSASSKSYSHAQALVHYVQGGILTPNEVREKLGESQLDDPVADELMLGVPVAPAASAPGGDE